MTALELLAPAKNLPCGIAAIDHGADAVYIGASRFGARVAAGNDISDIDALCRYAHQYGAKVYVTVNTLIHEHERADVRRLLEQLAAIRVDAVLVQDMQLLALANGLPLVLHASTQADNRTAEKLDWLRRHGFSRAVLARELSVGEIASLHRQVPAMELEVFVHGALCVSYSGLCYASEHCFHRSANRGECAQFCRMRFDLLDADGRELIHQRHLLSLKDLNLSAHLSQLIEAGAVSFKIEGRLKDVAYVKNVTAAYSELLNSYVAAHPDRYQRASRGMCRYTFQPDLHRTFNRGYTTYFVSGRQPGMASFYTPKAIGQFVGHVKELRSGSIRVAGTAAFANGDGLCFFTADRQLSGFRVNRAEGNLLFPQSMPAGLSVGMQLFRSNDQSMERVLSKPSAQRHIPVRMQLSLTPGSADEAELRLSVSDGRFSTSVSTPIAFQVARTPQHDYIVRELSKLGHTPYVCERVDLPAGFNCFVPASLLSQLRRSATEQLLHEATRGAAAAPYSAVALSADEVEPRAATVDGTSGRLLMQCRYCLRHELGYCMKHGGEKPQWREPLSLRLADGRRFPLAFDCVRCQMNVYADAK